MKGQNIESAQPLPPQPLMVRFLWLLLKEGKHLKGVQEVKLYNSDCKLYVLLKQCLPSRSLFNLIIFPKDRSIRHVDTRYTSQNRLCYMSDKNNRLRRKEYLLRNILISFVIGLTMIFFEALTAATYVQEFIWQMNDSCWSISLSVAESKAMKTCFSRLDRHLKI